MSEKRHKNKQRNRKMSEQLHFKKWQFSKKAKGETLKDNRNNFVIGDN